VRGEWTFGLALRTVCGAMLVRIGELFQVLPAVQTVIYPPARRRGVRPGSARTGLQNALLVVGGGVSRFSKAARSASIPLRRDDYCWSPQFSDQGPRLLLCDCR
jgi:hypothetical protein